MEWSVIAGSDIWAQGKFYLIDLEDDATWKAKVQDESPYPGQLSSSGLMLRLILAQGGADGRRFSVGICGVLGLSSVNSFEPDPTA